MIRFLCALFVCIALVSCGCKEARGENLRQGHAIESRIQILLSEVDYGECIELNVDLQIGRLVVLAPYALTATNIKTVFPNISHLHSEMVQASAASELPMCIVVDVAGDVWAFHLAGVDVHYNEARPARMEVGGAIAVMRDIDGQGYLSSGCDYACSHVYFL